MKIGIGIDPGSLNVGLSIINLDAGTPTPINQGYATLHPTRAADPAEIRLLSLEPIVYSWLAQGISTILGTTQWTASFITIEYPALSYTNKGAGKQNRHDSQFVLGMSYWMAYTTCARYVRNFQELNPTLSVGTTLFHVTPAQASEALGLQRGAPKEQRNIAAARQAGGYFAYDPQKPDRGSARGGALDGANPDALDAFAIAIAGWGEYHRASLEAAARPQGKRYVRRAKRVA